MKVSTSRPILCDGKVFYSAKAVATYLDRSKRSVYDALHKGNLCNGKKVEYAPKSSQEYKDYVKDFDEYMGDFTDSSINYANLSNLFNYNYDIVPKEQVKKCENYFNEVISEEEFNKIKEKW